MDQQGQSNQPQKQASVAQPPANLPGIDDDINPTNIIQESVENNNNVPERSIKSREFPEVATKKISSNPGINKFGEPEDLIPKNLPIINDGKEQSEVSNIQETEKPKEQQFASDLTKTINNKEEDKYIGPSIENLERKNLIKKIISLVVVGIILIFGIIFIYNKWIKKPVTEDNQPVEVIEKEPVVEEDIDEDGMPNEWEEKYGLNPNDARDADQDPDFDRLSNKKEYEYGTDPKNSDTDGDGFKDGEEVQGGFNPNGLGKLSDINSQADYYPTIKGKWQGNMTGAAYSSETLEATLQSNGSIAGNLIYNILNTDGRSLECDINGVFTFKKETSAFTSKINSNAGYREGKKILTRGDFNLNLMGTLKNNQKEISGTWVLEPVTNIFWLKQDRGNFLLKKTADF